MVTESSRNCILTRCAQAVEQSDFGRANELINELRQHSSAYGNGSQRMAHYFMEALVGSLGCLPSPPRLLLTSTHFNAIFLKRS